jgi:formylglycine-generating enzyme required for sulfatase activity
MKHHSLWNALLSALLSTALALPALLLIGCPNPTNEGEGDTYGIRLSVDSFRYVQPTGSGYVPPEPLTVTITNTGNTATGDLTARVAYTGSPLWEAFPLTDDGSNEGIWTTIPGIPKGGTGQFTVYIDPTDTTGYFIEATVKISNSNIKAELPLLYGSYDIVESDITVGDDPLTTGQSGRTATTDEPDFSPGGTLWFSGDETLLEINPQTGSLTLKNQGETYIGFMVVEADGRRVLHGKKVKVLRPDYTSLATLKSLKVNGVDVPGFTPESAPAGGGYAVTVAYAAAKTTVTAELSELIGNATIDNATQTIEIACAETKTVTVTVTAQNGTNTAAYTLNITRPSIASISAVAAKDDFASPLTRYLRGLGMNGLKVTGTDTLGNEVTLLLPECTVSPADFANISGTRQITVTHTPSGAVSPAVEVFVTSSDANFVNRPTAGRQGKHIGMFAATVSSNVPYTADYPPAGAVDGDWKDYGWSNLRDNMDYPKNLTLEFEHPVRVNRAVIWQEPGVQRIKNFKIQYRDAAGVWQDAYTNTTLPPALKSEYAFDNTVESTGIQLTLLDYNVREDITILEFELHCDSEVKATLKSFKVNGVDVAGFTPDSSTANKTFWGIGSAGASFTLTAEISDGLDATLSAGQASQTVNVVDGVGIGTVTVTSTLDSTVTNTYTYTMIAPQVSADTSPRTITVPKVNISSATIDTDTVEFKLLHVPAGVFSRDTQNVNVTAISKPYRMAETEVTITQFNAVMGKVQDTNGDWIVDATYTASSGKYPQRDAAADNAAGQMSFFAAIAFCNKLSVMQNKTPVYTVAGITDWGRLTWAAVAAVSDLDTTDSGTPSGAAAWNNVGCDWSANGYRLPTEMEWMWAALGAGYGLTPDNGLYKPSALNGIWAGKELGKTFDECVATGAGQVKQKAANVLGLYDLCGNVGEIVWDKGTGGGKTWLSLLLNYTDNDTTITTRRVKGGGGTQSDDNKKNFVWGDSVIPYWMRWGSNGFRIAGND